MPARFLAAKIMKCGVLDVGEWMLDAGHCEDEGRSRMLDAGR